MTLKRTIRIPGSAPPRQSKNGLRRTGAGPGTAADTPGVGVLTTAPWTTMWVGTGRQQPSCKWGRLVDDGTPRPWWIMLGIENFSLLLVSCILLNITPGQDTFYIVGRSLAQGRLAGLWSVAGIMSGVLVHTMLAALGLSTLLATSALAFSIVKYAGAGYLVWLGVGMLRRGADHQGPRPELPRRLAPWALYRQGILTNLLNPKVALFFLSFLPQFVAPHNGHAVVPFLVMGLVFFTTGSLWCLFLVLAAAWATRRLRRHTATGAVLSKMTGAVFVWLGLKLAFSSEIDAMFAGTARG